MTTYLKKLYRAIMSFISDDITWMLLRGMPHKLTFLIQKYLLLAFPFLFWNSSKNSYIITIAHKPFLLESARAITVLQSTFIENSWLQHFVTPGGLVVDIGAHVGEFAIFCEQYLQTKKIISIEPVRASYERLYQNSSGSTYYGALCITPSLPMHIPEQHWVQSAMASKFSISEHDRIEQAPCISLSSIPELANFSQIDLLKIDVEGMEWDVVEMCADSIRQSKYVLIEISIDRPSTKLALDVLCEIKKISPTIQICHIGVIYNNERRIHQRACDILFQNNA